MITYGGEIWGYINVPSLEQIQSTFLKCNLGMYKSTPIPGVRTELGIHPIESYLVFKVFSYCMKILSMEPDRLLKLYFEEEMHNMLPHTFKCHLTIWVLYPISSPIRSKG